MLKLLYAKNKKAVSSNDPLLIADKIFRGKIKF